MQPRKIMRICAVLGLFLFDFLNSNPLMTYANNNSQDTEFFDFQSIFDLHDHKGGFRGLRAASENGLTTKINQSVTDEDITFRIHEIYYFGNQIGYTYSLKTDRSDLEIKYQNFTGIPEIVFNGKLINTTGSNWGEKILEDEYVGMSLIDIYEVIPEEGELTLQFKEVLNVRGSWYFKFPIKEAPGEGIQISRIENLDPKDVDVIFAKKNEAEIAVLLKVNEDFSQRPVLFDLLNDAEHLIMYDMRGVADQEVLRERNQLITTYIYKFSVPSEGLKELTLRADENLDKSDEKPLINKFLDNIFHLFKQFWIN